MPLYNSLVVFSKLSKLLFKKYNKQKNHGIRKVELEKAYMQQSKLKSNYFFFLLSFSHSINHHELSTLFFIFLEMISGWALYPPSKFSGMTEVRRIYSRYSSKHLKVSPLLRCMGILTHSLCECSLACKDTIDAIIYFRAPVCEKCYLRKRHFHSYTDSFQCKSCLLITTQIYLSVHTIVYPKPLNIWEYLQTSVNSHLIALWSGNDSREQGLGASKYP